MGGFANNAPIVTNGLVLYVDAGNNNSYPESGTTWTDLIGGNNGTLTNGPTYNSGNGGYIDLDGSNDLVNFGNTGIEIRCMNCWFYIDAQVTSTTTRFGFLSFDTTGVSSDPQGGCTFGSASSYGTNETFMMLDGTGSGDYGRTYIKDNIPAGWNNIVMNWNGSSYDIWLNNSKKTAYTGTDNNADVALITSTDLALGGSFWRSGDTPFNGRWALLSIYNSSLTDAQVTQNYNALKNRFI
jgi:hypothetical protein